MLGRRARSLVPLLILLASCATKEAPPVESEQPPGTGSEGDLTAPIAVDDDETVAEAGNVRIDVLLNDSDAQGPLDMATIAIDATPQYGTATVEADGRVLYTHDGSESTDDTLSYSVQDLAGNVSNLAVVRVTISPVNDPPVAVDDAYQADEGALTALDLASNDIDVDDGLDLSSLTITGNPNEGTVIVNGDGTVDYQHDGSDSGADSFTYQIRDLAGELSNEATVDIAVNNINDAPISTGDIIDVLEGQSQAVDLAANDLDPDGSLDLGSIAIVAQPAYGSVVINGGGTVQYDHDGSETAADSFTYTIDDDSGATSNIATVDVRIQSVNDSPIAIDDAAVVTEGGEVDIDLAANDSDPDDGLDLGSISVAQRPAYGSVVENGDGTVTYLHDGSDPPTDTFTYTINDLSGSSSNVAVVDITVGGVNDPPVAIDDLAELEVTGDVIVDVGANDIDPDDGLDRTTVAIVDSPAFGTVVVFGDGAVEYTYGGLGPFAGDTFTYTIDDYSGVTSNVATVEITPVADCIQLDHLGLETQILPFPLSGVSPATHYMLANNYAVMPGDRLYLLADYNLKNRPWDMHWGFFLYPLDPDPQCHLNLVDTLDENVHWMDTDIWYPDGTQVPLVSLWGDGMTQGADEGINIWDVSDIVSSDAECAGQTATQALDLSPSFQIRFIFWDYGGVGDAVVRHFDLYVGHEIPCP